MAVASSLMNLFQSAGMLTPQQTAVCKALGLNELPQTKADLDAALAKLEQLDIGALADVAPPLPKRPELKNGTMTSRLQKLQRFIEEFQYNHTGRRFIDLKKTEGMYRMSRTSKHIIENARPIKCIEAVFLGAYLTLGIKTLTRIPIAFKSRVSGSSSTFQHIVMAVAHSSHGDRKWGAIGLSRAQTLMYKPLKYNTLSALLQDYKTAYEREHHELLNIYVGLPFGQDEFSQIPIQWRVLRLNVATLPWSTIEQVLAMFTTNANRHLTAYLSNQQLPDDMSEMYNGHLEPAATKIMVKSPKRASAAKKTSVSPKKKKLKKKKIKKIRSDDGGGEGKEEEKEEGKEGTGGEKRESDDKSETGDKTGEDEGNEEEEGEEDDDDDEEEIKFVGEERKICLAPADEGQQELSPTRMSFLGV